MSHPFRVVGTLGKWEMASATPPGPRGPPCAKREKPRRSNKLTLAGVLPISQTLPPSRERRSMTAEIIRLADRAPKSALPTLNAAQRSALGDWHWTCRGDLELKTPGYLFTATPLPGGRTRLKIAPKAQTLELPVTEYKNRVAA